MKDLEYFKKELIKILDKKEREEKAEIKKSLAFTMDMLIEKSSSGYPIGTIREWKGKKYQKIAPGKWRRKYSNEEKGIRMSIAALKKAIDKCSTSQELLNLVLQNRDRFADDNGRPLPIVKELSEYASAKNDKIESSGKNKIKPLSENIDTILNGQESEKEKLKQTFFKIADTSEELQAVGLKGERFVVRYGVISRHKNKDKDHDFTAEEWKDICKKINKPVLVTKYKNGYNLYLDVIKNGKHTLIGVDVKSVSRNLIINNVKTAFASDIDATEEIVLDNRNKKSGELAMSDEDQSSTYSSSTAYNSNIAQNNSPVNKKMTYATDVCKSVEDLENYAKENYGITIKNEDKKGGNTEKILKCFDITERFIKKVPGLEKYVKTIIYGKIDHKTMGYYNQNDHLLKIGEFGEDVTEEQVRTGYYGEMKHTVRHEMTHAIQHMIVNEYLSDKKKEQYEQAFKESFRNAYYTGKPKDMAKIANFFLHRVIGGQDFLAAAFDLFKEYKDGDYYRSMYSQFARNLVSEKIVDTALSNLGLDKKRRHFSLRTAVGKNVEELKGATKEVARISKYALSEDAECMADAIADALGSGENAAPLSKEILKVVENIVGSKGIEMLKSIYAKKKPLFVVKKSFADNFMNKRSIPTLQKSIFVRGDFDDYKVSDEELKEHSIFARTEDGCEYDLQNPTENFYYTLKENLEKSLTWSGHKLQDRTSWNGLKISIENKKGSVRRGVDKDGHQWATKMHFDYGYIRGSEGTDGDHLDCVSPDTKILMANYTEKRADEIVLGDELVGIEIETHQYQQRKQIKTKVVNLSKGVDEMLEITLSNGVKLNTTKGHLHYIFKNRRDKIWKRADELKVGDRLTGIFNHKDLAETEEYKKGYLYGAYLGDGSVSFDETKQVYCDIRKGVAYADVIYRVKRFWNDLGLETSDVRIKQARQTKSLLKGGRKITSKMDMAIFCIRGIDKIRFVKNILVRNAESFEWCRGYLAGIYDTDGCLNNRHELQITQTKNQNEFMEFTKKCIATLGFNAVQRNNEIKLNSNLMADNITMEFTQLLKPSLEKKRNFLGQTYRFEPVEIVSIKAYKGNFIAIQTDKQTYIANGFVTHNCYIGDNEDAKKVYIVHQNDPITHKYDEDKCMLGFNSLEDAKKAYLMQYDRPGFLGKIDTMDFDEFKEFILLKRNHGKKIIKSYTDFVKSVGENFDFETMRKVCII